MSVCDVEERLKAFMRYFETFYVKYFEEYFKRLDESTPKAGKSAELIDGICSLVGDEVLDKLKAGMPVALINRAVTAVGVHHNREELKKLTDKLILLNEKPREVRRIVIGASAEIFRCYESQLTRVTSCDASKSWRRALSKMAHDAVCRVIDYDKLHPMEELSLETVTKGVIEGNSRKFKHTSLRCIPKLTRGHTVELEGRKESTKDLFEKVGIRKGNSYFHIRGRETNLGFRQLLVGEDHENDAKYARVGVPRDEYKYLLNKDNLVKVQEAVENERSQDDGEEYTQRLLEQMKKDAKSDTENIMRNIQDSFDQVKMVLDKIADSSIKTSLQVGDLQETTNKIETIVQGLYDKVVLEKAQGEKPQSLVRTSFNVEASTNGFTGRRKELVELYNATHRVTDEEVFNITAVCGMGGVGKTQLLRKYIEDYGEKYDDVLWMDAGKEALPRSFRDLATRVLIGGTKDTSDKETPIKDTVNGIYKHFKDMKCLFVFDNVDVSDDEEIEQQLTPYLPTSLDSCKHHILISSQYREWSADVKVVALGILDRSDAEKLVRNGLKDSSTEDIQELASELQYFPLAIQQAIAYIHEEISFNLKADFNIKDYLKLFREKEKKIVGYKKSKKRELRNVYSLTIFTTWEVSIDKIKKCRDDGQLSMKILHVMAYLGSDNIKKELFDPLDVDGEDLVTKAVRLLMKFSIITGKAIKKDNRKYQTVFSIHRLVQAVIRIKMGGEKGEQTEEKRGENDEEAMMTAFKLLARHFPDEKIDALDDVQMKKDLLPHLESLLSHVENFINKNVGRRNINAEFFENMVWLMGRGYIRINPHRSKELLERCVTIRENRYGPKNIEIAFVLDDLGEVCGMVGEAEQKSAVLRRSLTIKEQQCAEHPSIDNRCEVARTLSKLARTYTSPVLARRALTRALELYGNNNIKSVGVLLQISAIHRANREGQQEREVLQNALAIQEEHGDDQLVVLRMLAKLSYACNAVGDLRAGEEFMEKALVIYKKLDSDISSVDDIIVTLRDVALAYASSGDPSNRILTLKECLEIQNKCYGKNHFEYANTIRALGFAFWDSGEHSKAIELLEEELKTKELNYGCDSIQNSINLEILANWWSILGNKWKAIEIFDRFSQIDYKNSHRSYGGMINLLTYDNLGDPKRLQGRYDYLDYAMNDQISNLEWALGIKEGLYGSDLTEISDIFELMGRAYQGVPLRNSGRNNFIEANEVMERVLKIQEKHYGNYHIEIARTLENTLGCAYGHLREYEKQREVLERALTIREKHYGSDHIEIARTLEDTLGCVYSSLNMYEKQCEVLERALKIREKHYGNHHIEIARTLEKLDCFYCSLNNKEKQREVLERALKIREKHYGSDHIEIAHTLENTLSSFYGSLNECEKQREVLERALKIREKHYGSDHIKIAHSLEELGRFYGSLNKYEKQRGVLERALKIREKHYGSDHIKIADTLEELGRFYGSLNEYEKQREALERALTIQKKRYGSDHIEIAHTLENLGHVYDSLNKYEKQKKVLERALKIREKHYGSDHIKIADTLEELGRFYGRLNKYDKQIKALERALTIKEKRYGSDHIKIDHTLENLSRAYGRSRKYEKQREVLERALTIREKHYGSGQIEIANTLEELERVYGCLRNYEKRREVLERALTIRESCDRGIDNISMAPILRGLGQVYLCFGEHDKSREALERALKIQARFHRGEHSTMVDTLEDLSRAYHSLKMYDKEREILERHLKIAEEVGDDIKNIRALRNLGLVYSSLGQPDKESEVLEMASQFEDKMKNRDLDIFSDCDIQTKILTR